MINRPFKYTLLVFFLSLATNALFSQGWERIYFSEPSGTMEYSASFASRVFQQNDGSFLFAANVEGQPKFLSTDQDGLITNLIDIPSSSGLLIRSSDQNYVYAARTYSSSPPDEDVQVTKFDESGNIVWTHRPEGNIFGNETVTDLLQSSDGNYVFVGTRPNYPYITKINEAGDLLWKTQGPQLDEDNIYEYSLTETADGGYFMIASSNWFTENNPIITNAIKLDQDGNLEWFGSLDTDLQVKQITLTADGNLVLLGRKMNYNYSLLKIDTNGNTIWEQVLPFSNYPFGFTYSLITTSDNGFAFLGNSQGEQEDIHLVKANENGIVEWQQTYGGPFRDVGYDLKQTLDGGYVIAGSGNGLGEDIALYIINTDENGVSVSNLIHGHVKYDLNENCVAEDAEQGLENWIVSASNNNGIFYAAVDENGYYQIEVEANTYEVVLTPPNEYWTPCTNQIPTSVTDTSTVDFAVQSVAQCPLMEVEVHNFGFRLCEEATINVFCQNQGTQLAEGVYVEIILDDSLQLLSASVPYTLVEGNTYSFDVGDIDFLNSSTFSLQVNVGCDIELMGQTLCVDAHIFPDTSCLPTDQLWSGASIQLSAECIEDEVRLNIENVGQEDMLQALSYNVIEDHVIMLQGQTYGPLLAGESISLPKIANGTFYRIESDQVAFHPGMSMPSAFIEGCGTSDNGEVSLGFVNQYPLDDADYFVDLSCTEVLAAYDPNIKQAFPIGYNNEHFIEANTKIDYVIHFQNTGTAVANNVVITDKLSAKLDPASIRIGVSSHTYDFELLADGIVQFTFRNIQLPDSSANEAASHGYVQFSIAQKENLSIGTVIENTAAIYFDYNPPIFTNTTYHTIGQDFILVDVGEVFDNNVSVKVFPNPFIQSATIEVEGNDLGTLSILLFDASGKQVVNDQFSGSGYQLSRNELPSGVYFYQIMNTNGMLNIGKLIVQ